MRRWEASIGVRCASASKVVNHLASALEPQPLGEGSADDDKAASRWRRDSEGSLKMTSS